MLTGVNFEKAIDYYKKGKEVIVLDRNSLGKNEKSGYDTFSFSELGKNLDFLVDVPAVPNQEFEQAVQDMVEPDQNENDTEGDEQLPPPDQPEKKLEKETVAAPGKMSREEKSKIIRPLIKKGLKNKEIAEHTGIPLGTVNGLSGPIRKELKNPAKAERIKSGDNSDRHKCRTCQYRHSDAGGCDYCIHTGKERGCDVEVCDKAVAGARLTKK
ncbi:hypothetical protein [Dorea formicigenerans]|uniref:Uncharacterized protein n=1 Tax=Dorea formicigenerans TaxID=39486 RepID=A0A3E4MEM0_9FIRM|nr:hypothetical protein [Dorea formicigenerans]RGK48024.1 hypothetical protein DXD10_07720 [Dorea formicigenerans]